MSNKEIKIGAIGVALTATAAVAYQLHTTNPSFRNAEVDHLPDRVTISKVIARYEDPKTDATLHTLNYCHVVDGRVGVSRALTHTTEGLYYDIIFLDDRSVVSVRVEDSNTTALSVCNDAMEEYNVKEWPSRPPMEY